MCNDKEWIGFLALSMYYVHSPWASTLLKHLEEIYCFHIKIISGILWSYCKIHVTLENKIRNFKGISESLWLYPRISGGRAASLLLSGNPMWSWRSLRELFFKLLSLFSGLPKLMRICFLEIINFGKWIALPGRTEDPMYENNNSKLLYLEQKRRNFF